MTYEIMTEPHQCELPPPEDFEYGVEIRCTKPRLRNGTYGPCGNRYRRSYYGVFKSVPVWSSDWSW